MKKLARVSGLRDCSLMECMTHIANLSYQFRQDRRMFENPQLPHDSRAQALERMIRERELIKNWQEVLKDIQKSTRKEAEQKRKAL